MSIGYVFVTFDENAITIVFEENNLHLVHN